MKKIKLKKPVVISLYSIAFIFVIGAIFLVQSALGNKNLKNEDEGIDKTIFDTEEIPVVTEQTTMIKPFKDEDVTILKNYYDYKAKEETQQKSIIYYENTYLPSSGISYGKSSDFDVIAVLDGTVVDVKEDKIMGKIVEIKHDNDIISTYQSLSEVNVSKDDEVKQGDIIGKSGTSNIEKDLPSHVHFELIVKSKTVNPEQYYDKNINEI